MIETTQNHADININNTNTNIDNQTIPENLEAITPSSFQNLQSFQSFNLNSLLLKKLDQFNITQPTTIQTQSIPLLMTGVDVLASSKTGSGKTLAFSLPLLHNLIPKIEASPSPAKHPTRLLVLLPTRELAEQVFDTLEKLLEKTPARLACLLGGMDMREQKQNLMNGCDVIVATIGRLLDHLNQKNIHLTQLDALVLDEADRMLDMGFLPDLETLAHYLPKKRQTIMFSATFSPAIEKIAKAYLNEPQRLQANVENQTNEKISQIIYETSGNQKNALLLKIIYEQQKIGKQLIIFVNSKIDCNKIKTLLADYRLNVQALHGDIQQAQRQKIMQAFKDQSLDILVATDIAARGLDVPDLPMVINYHLPFSAEDYVHRIGRTGRAGAAGIAISLYTKRDEDLLQAIRDLTKQELPLQIFHKDALLNQAKQNGQDAANTSDLMTSEDYIQKVGLLLYSEDYTPVKKERQKASQANILERCLLLGA